MNNNLLWFICGAAFGVILGTVAGAALACILLADLGGSIL